ncbi:MAG: hypothetical protein HN544_07160 [Euryarchaeota archaeon]|jgi:hypothetical protein|nr:hypothetical protein [Euryarchaeota archaeon]
MIEDRLLARLGWVLPALTIFLSTLVHIVSGDYRDFPFFISEADYPGIQRIIFTGGFALTGIVLMYLSWRLFKINNHHTRWYWMYLSLLSGIFVGANLAVMAFMDMYDHIEIHVATAVNVFQFGLAWGLFTHLAFKDGSQRSKNLRYMSISLGFIGFFGMSYAISLGLKKYPEFIDGGWDMAAMQPWINWAAPLEYLLAVSFFLTLYSFESEVLQKSEEE